MNRVGLIWIFLLSSQFAISQSDMDGFAKITSASDYIELNTGEVLYGEVEHIDERIVNTDFHKKI